METMRLWLNSTASPWIGMTAETEEDKKWLPSYLYGQNSDKAIVRELRGRRMKTMQGLMQEFAAALQFFGDFGGNWYALKECLCYMDEWLPGDSYLLIIDDAQEVLANESLEELKWLLITLEESGEWWSKPITNNGRFNREALPFHALFKFSSEAYQQAQVQVQKLVGESNIKAW